MPDLLNMTLRSSLTFDSVFRSSAGHLTLEEMLNVSLNVSCENSHSTAPFANNAKMYLSQPSKLLKLMLAQNKEKDNQVTQASPFSALPGADILFTEILSSDYHMQGHLNCLWEYLVVGLDNAIFSKIKDAPEMIQN